jgi:hypothetical protein
MVYHPHDIGKLPKPFRRVDFDRKNAAEERLRVPLSKLAAGECQIKGVAKFLNAERLTKKLQAVIGSVPHNGIVTGDHNQWKPKRFGVSGE